MRTSVATYSLLLSVALAGTVMAPAVSPEGRLTLSQAHAQVAVAVGALLSDPRGPGELADDELSQRLMTIEAALQQDTLAEDNRNALMQRLSADRAELERRAAAAAPAPEEPKAAAQEAAPEAPADEPAVPRKKRKKVAEDAPPEDPAQAAAPEPMAEPPAEPVIAAEPAPEPVPDAPPKKRKKVAEEPAATPEPAPEQAAQDPAPATEQVAAPEAPVVAGPELEEAAALLQDQREPSTYSADELKDRMKRARTLARNKNLPEDMRAALNDVVQNSRRALMALDSGGAPKQPEAPALAEQPPAPADGAPAEVPPAVAEQPAAPAETPAATAEAVKDIAAPPPDLAAAPKVVQADEAQAAAVIADTSAATKLDDAALKERMEVQRELLEDGTISGAKAKSLRAKLKADREALRARIAEERQDAYLKAQAEAKAGGEVPTAALPAPVIAAPTAAEMPKLLRDRRQAGDLDEIQLNKRIRAFRQAVRQPPRPRLDDDEAEDLERDAVAEARRQAYIQELERDRAELRRRLVAEKQQRRTLQRQRPERNGGLTVELNVDLTPTRQQKKRRVPPPPAIWAAEAEDDEIERYLVARPTRRVPQQYVAPRRTVMLRPELYVSRPEVRDSLPSVEVDTITFGFGEAFIREEEVVNLDRIGLIMERILAKHPEEVFLIEGHTDAVGGDPFNLRLSKQRANAVKRALTEYYLIPPEAISTVGLGERYLKIWTPEPEQENRRVTLRRITPVLSEYQGTDLD